MANSIAAAPAVLAQGVIKALANKLPMLSGFSTLFTTSVQNGGAVIAVPLIGTSTATEFGADGYLSVDPGKWTTAPLFARRIASVLTEQRREASVG